MSLPNAYQKAMESREKVKAEDDSRKFKELRERIRAAGKKLNRIYLKKTVSMPTEVWVSILAAAGLGDTWHE